MEVPVAIVVVVIVVVIAVTILVVLVRGLFLVFRDTQRRSGKWGINRNQTACPRCGLKTPVIRAPSSWQQVMWGGWTCTACGCEMDKWGKEMSSSGED